MANKRYGYIFSERLFRFPPLWFYLVLLDRSGKLCSLEGRLGTRLQPAGRKWRSTHAPAPFKRNRRRQGKSSRGNPHIILILLRRSNVSTPHLCINIFCPKLESFYDAAKYNKIYQYTVTHFRKRGIRPSLFISIIFWIWNLLLWVELLFTNTKRHLVYFLFLKNFFLI